MNIPFVRMDKFKLLAQFPVRTMFDLNSLFNGISTLVGYLMPKHGGVLVV